MGLSGGGGGGVEQIGGGAGLQVMVSQVTGVCRGGQSGGGLFIFLFN